MKSGSRLVIVVVLILTAFWLLMFLVDEASAQGPVVPPPPPVATPVNPVDRANAEADKWQTIANQAVQGAQAAIGQAYAAIANAQAGLQQALIAAQQEHAARVAAEQGQIQQASQSAQAALVAANQATSLANSANGSAIESMRMTTSALRDVQTLRNGLRQLQTQSQTTIDGQHATIAGLTGANATRQARIDQLETYSWSIYRETIIAWVVAGVLGFVLLAGICALVIIIAMERRNRWPRFKNGIGAALVVPLEKSDSGANNP